MERETETKHLLHYVTLDRSLHSKHMLETLLLTVPDVFIHGNVQRTPRQVIKEQIVDEASQECLQVGLLGNGGRTL